MTYKMKGPSLLKMVSKLKDLRGTKEKGEKVDLTVKPNPTTKAVKNKDYKIDEKEEQVIENMSNQETRSEIIRHEKYLKDLEKAHNVSANITEGSIESQELRRKENAKKK